MQYYNTKLYSFKNEPPTTQLKLLTQQKETLSRRKAIPRPRKKQYHVKKPITITADIQYTIPDNSILQEIPKVNTEYEYIDSDDEEESVFPKNQHSYIFASFKNQRIRVSFPKDVELTIQAKPAALKVKKSTEALNALPISSEPTVAKDTINRGVRISNDFVKFGENIVSIRPKGYQPKLKEHEHYVPTIDNFESASSIESIEPVFVECKAKVPERVDNSCMYFTDYESFLKRQDESFTVSNTVSEEHQNQRQQQQVKVKDEEERKETVKYKPSRISLKMPMNSHKTNLTIQEIKIVKQETRIQYLQSFPS